MWMQHCRRTRRWILMALAVFASPGVARGDEPAGGEATPTTPAADEPSAAVRGEIEKIQQSLGGSIVNQFPGLEPAADPAATLPAVSPPQPVVGPPSRGPNARSPWYGEPTPTRPAPPSAFARPRPKVAVLRATAAELDAAANRLEQAELYQQADALRAQAQSLRVDARALGSPKAEDPAPEDGEVMEAPAWQVTPAPQPQEPQEPEKPRRFGYSTRGRATRLPPPSIEPY